MAKDVVINLKIGGQQKMLSTLTDYKAGFDMIYGAVTRVGSAMDEALTTGQSLGKLYAANTLSIDKAAEATKGYITKLDLLKAANLSTAFGLGFSEQQFAKLSEAAVIMSQRLGTDAPQAMNDLMVGLSRQSKKILDNLGIIVSAGKANEDYAKSIGKAVKSLDDAQRAEAFKIATMKEVTRLTEGQSVAVRGAGDAWVTQKNKLTDYINEEKLALASNTKFRIGIEATIDTLKWWAEALGLARTRLARLYGTVQGKGHVELGLYGLDSKQASKAYLSGLDSDMEAVIARGGPGPRERAKAKAKSGRSSAAKPDGLSTEGVQSRLKAEAMIAEMEAQIRLTDATARYNAEAAKSREAVADLIGSYRKKTAATSKAAEAERAEADALRRKREEEALHAETVRMVTGTVGDLTSAIWAAADAADGSAAAFGRALVNEFKQLMKAKAIEATVLGTMAMARYALSWGTDAAALSSAGMYFAAAGAAGVGYAGASAISSAAGGSAARPSTASSDRTSPERPSFGRASAAKKQDVYVNLYIGTPDDPGAALIGAQHVKAAIAA